MRLESATPEAAIRSTLPTILFVLLLACSGSSESSSATQGDSSPASEPEAAAEDEAATEEPDQPEAPGTVLVERIPAPGAATVDEQPRPKRWLGISVANMNEPIEGAPEDRRAMIQRAFRGGPAHLAGLQRGDVIIQAAGKEVIRYQDYIAEARQVDIGQSLGLRVLRAGSPLDFSVEMVEKPGDAKAWRRQHFPGTESFAYDLPALRPAGERASSSSAAGRPQLLYFWATWCGPCRRTSPMVERLHEDAGDRLQIVGISSEEEEVLRPFLLRSTTTYTIARDELGSSKLDYEVKSLPTVVLIDSDGSILAWDYGLGGVRRTVAAARSLLKLTP